MCPSFGDDAVRGDLPGRSVSFVHVGRGGKIYAVFAEDSQGLGGMAVSDDGGKSWLACGPKSWRFIDQSSVQADGAFYMRPSRLGSNGLPYLYGSLDGLRWDMIMLKPCPLGYRPSYAVGTDGYVYSGTSEGIFRSKDGGSEWSDITPEGLLHFPWIQEIRLLPAPVAGAPDWIYALSGFDLIVSRDGGASWAKRSLPAEGPSRLTHCTALTVAANGCIYVGMTSQGLFLSHDDGATWNHRPFKSERPSRFIQEIAVRGHMLYLALWSAKGGAPGVAISDDMGFSWRFLESASDGVPDDVTSVHAGPTIIVAGTISSGVIFLDPVGQLEEKS